MSVKAEIKRGIFYTTLFKYSNYFLQLLISTVLARLLTPEEYGVVAIINVFVLFFLMLSAFGLGEAIVQNQNLNEFDISSLFYISVFLAFTFSFLFLLSGSFVADFYSNKEYINITRLLSLSLFFYTLNTVPSHLLRKAQRFKTIGIINLCIILISGTSTIFFALNGFSYYSLVYKSIIDSFLELVLSFILVRIKLHKTISFRAFKEVFNFALFQLLYNFIAFVSRNIDIIIIGKFLGSTSLGFYERSVRLFSTVTSLSQVISPVLHPILSNRQNDKELLYNVFRKITKIISLIAMPLSFLLFFAADEIILLLYGNQWLNTIPVFKYMALMVWIYLLLTTNVSFFQVLGKTNFLFIYGIIYFLLLATAVAIGVFIDSNFVKVAFYILISNTVLLVFSYLFLVKKLFNKDIFAFLYEFRSGIYISIAIVVTNIIFDIITLEYDSIIIKLIFRFVLSTFVGYLLLKIQKEDLQIINFIRNR